MAKARAFFVYLEMSNTNHPTLGNGKICYFEMPSNDIAESAAFYQKGFGWKVRTRGDGSVAFDDAVEEVSGTWVTGREPYTGSGLSIHIMVDDIDITMALIVENGGKVVEGIGKHHPEITASFSDPTGNVFWLYQGR